MRAYGFEIDIQNIIDDLRCRVSLGARSDPMMLVSRAFAFVLFLWVASSTGALASVDSPQRMFFGGDPAYPPYEWNEGGIAKGLHVDVEDTMGARTNTLIIHRSGPWHDVLDALANGTLDVVPMMRTEERERRFWFSEPIYIAQHAIYTRRDPGGIFGRDDLTRWKVAVERSSFAYEQFKAGNLPSQQVIATQGTPQALAAVVQGRADYAVLALGPADYIIRTQKLPLVRVGRPFWPQEYAFAVRKDRIFTRQWVQARFDEISHDGTLDRLTRIWRVDTSLGDRDRIGMWPAVMFAVFSALAVAVFFFRLRREVLNERAGRSSAEERLLRSSEFDSITSLPNRTTFLEQADRLFGSASDEPLDMIVVKLLDREAARSGQPPNYDQGTLRQVATLISGRSLLAGAVSANTLAALLRVGDSNALVAELRDSLGDLEVGSSPKLAVGAARMLVAAAAGKALDRAEVALAAALARGRTWMIYDPALQPDPSQVQLVRDFELFGREQIFAEFQPQLNLRSGLIDSAEVLARWDHPIRGRIPPSEFVPLLEAAGLIHFVTSKMIDEAARLDAQLAEAGMECRLSVNLSVMDMVGQNVGRLLRDTAKAYRARLHNLMVELTETSAIEDPIAIDRTFRSLKRMGVKTAIDDFGTGFSSLTHLTNLNADELKIDQSFVSKMQFSSNHRKVVISVIEMAHQHGLAVVAEGAEDAQTIQELARLGCERVQGYAIAKPLRGADFLSFLRTHNSESMQGAYGA